jgi:acyl-CoA hydrolase/GNAT superfamily N-acetyltransferase
MEGASVESESLYRDRRVTAEEALRAVKSGQSVLVGSGCAAPQELLRGLVARAPRLADVNVVHLLTFGVAPYVEKKYEGSFRHNAFFIGPNVRPAVQEGRADYTPVYLSEIPDLFRSRQMHLDVALVMVSPPDEFGYCSLGIHPDIMMAGVGAARTVIAQVNRHMPRVHGDTFVHVSRLDHIVEHDEPLLELSPGAVDETSMAIARHVAPLVDDGATLQIGIGPIPNAVLSLLEHHLHLGVHTEMMSDGVVDLCEKGVVTNARKTLHQGKVLASFAMGTKGMYDYIDDNPLFEFHQTGYVNAPSVIARNEKMVSINAALEVDITGQVCSDSLGPLFYSGIGGQVDFTRGAALSPGGKPILVLPSTAENGTISRIVPSLDEGAGVVLTRGDVHYVVTEYGAAYLHGKTIRERAMALIEIAHPDFRPELRAAAVGRRYVPAGWELPSEARRYPSDMEERHDFKGKKLLVRPLRSADSDRLMEFFYSHSPETVYRRYRFPKKSLPREEAIRMCTLDYSRRFALAVFREEGRDEHIAAVGRYHLNERTRMAETAFVVHEDYRRLGIATYLFERLEKHARRNGILGFYAELEPTNVGPVKLHRSLGHQVVFDQKTGIYGYTVPFDEDEGAEENA